MSVSKKNNSVKSKGEGLIPLRIERGHWPTYHKGNGKKDAAVAGGEL